MEGANLPSRAKAVCGRAGRDYEIRYYFTANDCDLLYWWDGYQKSISRWGWGCDGCEDFRPIVRHFVAGWSDSIGFLNNPDQIK